MKYPKLPNGPSGVGAAAVRGLQATDSVFQTKHGVGFKAHVKDGFSRVELDPAITQLLAWVFKSDEFGTYATPALISVRPPTPDAAQKRENLELLNLAGAFPASWDIEPFSTLSDGVLMFLGDGAFMFMLRGEFKVITGDFDTQVLSRRGFQVLRVTRDDDVGGRASRQVVWLNTAKVRRSMHQLYSHEDGAAREVSFAHRAYPEIEFENGAVVGSADKLQFVVLGKQEEGGRGWGVVTRLLETAATIRINEVRMQRYSTRNADVVDTLVVAGTPIPDSAYAESFTTFGLFQADVMGASTSDHKGRVVAVVYKGTEVDRVINGATLEQVRGKFAIFVSDDMGATWAEKSAAALAQRYFPDGGTLFEGFVPYEGGPDFTDHTPRTRGTYVGDGKFIITMPGWYPNFGLGGAGVYAQRPPAAFLFDGESLTALPWAPDAWMDSTADLVPVLQNISMCFGRGCMYHPVKEAGNYTVLFTHDFGQTWQRSGVIPIDAYHLDFPPMFTIVRPAKVEDSVATGGEFWLLVPGADHRAYVTDATFATYTEKVVAKALEETGEFSNYFIGRHAAVLGTATLPAHTIPGLTRTA